MNILNQSRELLFAHNGGSQSGSGQGSYDFVAYLKSELASEFNIHFPVIDDPEAPTYEMWKKMFKEELDKLNAPVTLIGHSLGGSMLLKYLSEEPHEISITGLFLISVPYWGKNGWDVVDFALAEAFEEKLKRIQTIYFYQSKDDTVVPFSHLNFYMEKIGHAVVRDLPGKDRVFVNGLPQLIADIKNVAQISEGVSFSENTSVLFSPLGNH